MVKAKLPYFYAQKRLKAKSRCCRIHRLAPGATAKHQKHFRACAPTWARHIGFSTARPCQRVSVSDHHAQDAPRHVAQ